MHPAAWGVALALSAALGVLASRAGAGRSDSWLIAAAAGAAGIHLWASIQPLQSARVLAVLAAAAMVYAFCIRQDDRVRRGVWIALAVAGSGLALHGLWQSAIGFERAALDAGAGISEAMRARLASGRAVATLGLPAALAGFLALSIPVTAGLLAREAPGVPMRALLTASIMTQVAALLATRSAGAVLALGAAGTVCLAWRSSRRALALLPLAAGAAAAAGVLAWRMSGAARVMEGSGPVALRLGNWKAALEMLNDFPLLGGGLGCYGILFPAYRGWEMNESRFAHNAWLQIAAEAGAPAAVAAIAAAGLLALGLLERHRRGGSPWAAIGCLAFLGHNLLDITFYLPSVLLPFAALSATALQRPAPAAPPAPGAARPAVAWGAAALMLAGGAAWIAHGDALRQQAVAAARDAGTTSDRAVAAARRAVAWNPADPESRILVSRLLLERFVAARQTHELGDAERQALAAINRDRRTPGHWHQLGKVRLAMSDPQGAYLALHRAAELYPIRIEYREDRDRVAALLALPGTHRP